jgi:hypothetical protein
MKIKTAYFKNHLSHYLHQVQMVKEPLIIYERETPVAVLRAFSRDKLSSSKKEWAHERQVLLKKAKANHIHLSIPESKSPPMRQIPLHPKLAPDRRKDLCTVDFLRKGREY